MPKKWAEIVTFWVSCLYLVPVRSGNFLSQILCKLVNIFPKASFKKHVYFVSVGCSLFKFLWTLPTWSTYKRKAVSFFFSSLLFLSSPSTMHCGLYQIKKGWRSMLKSSLKWPGFVSCFRWHMHNRIQGLSFKLLGSLMYCPQKIMECNSPGFPSH